VNQHIQPGIVALENFVAEEAAQPVADDVTKLCAAIQARGKISAILFYGSGMWAAPDVDTVFDFYVLVESYRDFDPKPALAVLGSVLPPNVYYLEIADGERTLRCKYALMRIDQFTKAARGNTIVPQIWARFAQPSRIVYTRPDNAARVTRALAESVLTFHRYALPLIGQAAPVEQIWLQGLRQTFGTELRSENPERPRLIFATAPESFSRRSALAIALLAGIRRNSTWARIRCRALRPLQKSIAFLRLAKATFTFEGSVDYAIWKVERQSGVRLEATEFQRRHPLIGAWPLIWSAWRKAGFR
jgi:hypothetical protein